MFKKECRICYDDEEENASQFISPCACDGSRKYVHRECIEQWREIKHGLIDYMQCQECRQFYNIDKKYPLEHLTFNSSLSINSIDYAIIFSFNIIFVLFSPILSIMDKSYRIPTAMSIGDSSSFILFLKDNDFETHCYYYSFIIFISSIFAHIFIFAKIQYKIRNKIRYWNKILLYFIFTIVYNFNFYYLYLLTIDREYSAYCIISSIMSLFNILFITAFIGKHYRVLKNLNTIDNEEYLRNYNQPRVRSGRFERNIVLDII